MNKRVINREKTKERHSTMICKSYLVKIDKSHLGRRTLEDFKRLFLEAKWFFNYVISNGVYTTDYKTTNVKVKAGDELQEREIKILSSQMRQALVDRLKSNLKSLAVKKANGHKVGKLKFKKSIRSIPLKQFGNTYKIVGKNHIKIQKIKKKLRVRGLKQIPENAEYSIAYLIQDHGDYYLRTTAYVEPESDNDDKKEPTDNRIRSIGIDLGMKNQLTFSNAVSVKYRVYLTRKLRKLYQKFSRTKKGSNNRYKARLRIQKEFYRICNRKQDIKNKIVHYLKENYQVVCYQDDDIKEWQRIWGRKVLDTAIGGIKDILDERIPTPVAVPRDVLTTQKCHRCGNIEDIPLDKYIFECSRCGLKIHRDLNAAINIEIEGLIRLPEELREAVLPSMAGGNACGEETSTLAMVEYFNSIPHVRASLLVEAGSLTASA